ncbi:hypothetical protein [Paraburkholderia xenovorans]|uniref:hypothetical protein n=1 Tax=Paraburkholderia xenovorans TaxID=36873 RepID=UPI0038B9A738
MVIRLSGLFSTSFRKLATQLERGRVLARKFLAEIFLRYSDSLRRIGRTAYDARANHFFELRTKFILWALRARATHLDQSTGLTLRRRPPCKHHPVAQQDVRDCAAATIGGQRKPREAHAHLSGSPCMYLRLADAKMRREVSGLAVEQGFNGVDEKGGLSRRHVSKLREEDCIVQKLRDEARAFDFIV